MFLNNIEQEHSLVQRNVSRSLLFFLSPYQIIALMVSQQKDLLRKPTSGEKEIN